MPFLSMKGITRYYFDSGVLANDNVSFELERGEIHALVGENGAGKTTLMKILYGLEKKDRGSIYINGEEVDIHSPLDASRHGVGMVRQHFRLIPEFTVAENCVLGMEPVKNGIFFDRTKALAMVDDVIQANGFELKGKDRVGKLPVGKQQQTAIVRMLCRDDDILILDEPTSVLTDRQRDRLFETFTALAEKGKSIILITHKISEIKQIADRITVMKKGRVQGVYSSSDVDEGTLSRLIVGQDINSGGNAGTEIPGSCKEVVKRGVPVLELKSVSLSAPGAERPLLDEIDLEVNRGEIVGVTGISGNGLSELEDAVTGLTGISSGRILYKGEDITSLSIAERREAGIAYVPADRMHRGVSLRASIMENLIVVRRKEFFKRGIFLRKAAYSYSRDLVSGFSVTGDPVSPVKTLSGGNIQKVILSRELSAVSDFIVFSQPAWGLDAAASEFIYSRILDLKEKGKGILLISTDPDEILKLATRVAVMYRGIITGIFDNNGSLTGERIGDYMLGVAKNDR